METSSLVLNVKSTSVKTGSDRLKALSRSASTATAANTGLATSTRGMAAAQVGATTTTKALTGATAGLGATMLTTLAPILAMAAPLLAIKKLFGSTIEVQNYRAQLKTATGSVEEAAEAFDKLEEFASKTPFALGQSLEAFIKMTNLGLTPSERAMTSFGDTASAMGKDLNQMVEAVADAATGEFERLKEFGIKSKSEGDRVSFTFKGISTEVGKNAAEIEEYLTQLGENNFAGAMSDRMDTLGGKVSNLGDSWDKTFRLISESGADSIISDVVQTGIDLIEELNAMLESGQLEASLASWTRGFDHWAEDFDLAMSFVEESFGETADNMSEKAGEVNLSFTESLKLVPAAVRHYMKLAGVELYIISQAGDVAGRFLYDSFVNHLEALVKTAGHSAIQIAKALADPMGTLLRGGIDFKPIAAPMAELVVNQVAIAEAAYDEMEILRQALIASVGVLDGELDGAVGGVVELGRQSDRLREKYELEKAARMAARNEEDEARGAGKTGTVDPKNPKKTATGAKPPTGPSEFERLVESLQSEEEAIKNSYDRRLDLIRNNTDAGSEIRAELTEKLNSEYEGDIERLQEKLLREFEITQSGFDAQINQLDEYYAMRREIILQNEELTEEERTALLAELTGERNDLVSRMETDMYQERLSKASAGLDAFAALSNSSNKKLAAAGKAAAKVQKGIAIAQATIETYKAAQTAYAQGVIAGGPYLAIPTGIAYAAVATATGLANVAAIATTNVGNYASGGILGGTSSTGDAVTFNGNRGEVVMNFEQQKRLLNIANGGAAAGQGGGSGGVTIINQTSAPVEAETRITAGGDREIIIREAVNRTKSEIADEANTGGGTVVPAIQRNFSLRRTGT